MTFPEKTCYPVASQNLRDFYNLIDVYLDAVFYPLITPNAFPHWPAGPCLPSS
jgi:Zn-dependent M16 (insulinase) family peptidase